MDELAERAQRQRSRKQHQEEFLQRLFARRPEARENYQRLMSHPEVVPEVMIEGAMQLEAAGLPAPDTRDIVLETIVNEERPVLFVRDDWVDTENVFAAGDEAKEFIRDLNERRQTLAPLMPLIGRIDVADFPGLAYLGTGWLVDTDIVVTNRHVASLMAHQDSDKFVFSRGVGGRTMASSFNTLHEFDDVAPDQARTFEVKVLYIEPDSSSLDIAFLRVARRTDGSRQDRIKVSSADVGENVQVVAVGYPARAPKRVIPNQDLMRRLYLDRYDVKRAAPGLTMGPEQGSTRHDCTTLGGNSGSVVLNIKTGEAVGLHFAGLYQESNFAVRATVLNDYINRKIWTRPPTIRREAAKPVVKPDTRLQQQSPATASGQTSGAAGAGAVTVTIPLSITVSLGQPVTGGMLTITPGTGAGAAGPASGGGGGGAAVADPNQAEAAVRAFWDERPQGVIAARVGFEEKEGEIGDEVFIAASVPPDQLVAVAARGPSEYHGFSVRYLPANVTEQVESATIVESVDRISYDDDARTSAGFSFDQVSEPMTVRLHVGPEYSWDELKTFLDHADGQIVSAMYEFHGSHIKDTIEARLKAGASLTMVLDNASFTEVKHDDEEFDRTSVFKRWKSRFKERFARVVAPEGVRGLISDSYHIKVTVRDDDTFWLSSGNWKMDSSQPIVTEEQRQNASDVDLPGNREWHVIIRNHTLAERLRNHIEQDFKRSRDLGGTDVPASKEAADPLVDVALEEAPVLERRPPERILKPRTIERSVKVQPLLTPDQEGAVYSEALLELIRSARKSLLFQIPYIAMPSNPRADRGYIDELIKALTQKLKTLDDARVILRAGGSKFSAPTHAAWYFKSKGVDINERLRSIQNHHTKGMIVDGKHVLIGSHNWSKPGVTLNRDASLIFEDEAIASYYAEAFEIDWGRANPIKANRFVKTEWVILEAVGAVPPPGYRRIRLSELMKEDD
jgi:phosphatidylserine/phosphatidylglycerophosphate/cardiolipin synthase-like enzyme/V8-like Glu-specific endopeptidase